MGTCRSPAGSLCVLRLPCPGTGLGVRRPAGQALEVFALQTHRRIIRLQQEEGGVGMGQESSGPASRDRIPPASPRIPETQVPPASPGHQLVSPVSPHPRSAPRCSAVCIHLAPVEDFCALVTLHCFWAAFPLISFSFEILSSPSSELTGPFISKAAAGRRVADSCAEASGFLPPGFLPVDRGGRQEDIFILQQQSCQSLRANPFGPRGHRLGGLSPPCLLSFWTQNLERAQEVLCKCPIRSPWIIIIGKTPRDCLQTLSECSDKETKPREGKRFVEIAQQVSNRARLKGSSSFH